MFGFKLISESEFKWLRGEIELLRSELQEERSRADRLTDNIMQLAGAPPVSRAALHQQGERVKGIEDLRAQMSEIFVDEIGKLEEEVPEAEAAEVSQ